MRNFSIYTSDPDTLVTFRSFYPDRATAAPRHYVFYDFICPPRCSPKKSPEPRSRTGFCTRRSRRSFAAQQKYREANKFPKLELLILSQHQLLCCWLLPKRSSRDAFARGPPLSTARLKCANCRDVLAARTFQFPCARCCCFKYGSPSTNDKGFFRSYTLLVGTRRECPREESESPRRKLVAFHVFLLRAPFSARQILDLVCSAKRDNIFLSRKRDVT